jgi:hypothetical protein
VAFLGSQRNGVPVPTRSLLSRALRITSRTPIRCTTTSPSEIPSQEAADCLPPL